MIWALIPITAPLASSSGPPELPGLMAASVWIAPPMPKRVSELMLRSTAETTPTLSDWRSPNGLPIAATGSPTSIPAECPRRIGVRDRPAGFTCRRATSAFGSTPTISASTRFPSENSTYTCSARFALPSSVTTWAFVAM